MVLKDHQKDGVVFGQAKTIGNLRTTTKFTTTMSVDRDGTGTRDIPILTDGLGIPETIQCEQGSTCDGLEGLCLSFPCRYADMILQFAEPVPVLSMVMNAVLNIIYATHTPRITRWNHDILDPDQMKMYAPAITARGAPLQNCFGFIDHKRVHALKFQSKSIYIKGCISQS